MLVFKEHTLGDFLETYLQEAKTSMQWLGKKVEA